MFRMCRLLKGISPFTLFLMDQKNNPALKGVSVAKRGKIMSKMYRELSTPKKKELEKRAAKIPQIRKQQKKSKKHTEFGQFVKANYHKVKGLNYKKRFKALSQLYALQKPIDMEKEVRLVAKARGAAAATAASSAAKKKKVVSPVSAKSKVKKAAKAVKDAKAAKAVKDAKAAKAVKDAKAAKPEKKVK